MHITINEDFTALILDDADSPTKMLRMPSYDVSTLKRFVNQSQAQTQAEKYAAKAHLFADYISPEKEAEQLAADQKAIAIADINAAFVREVKAITDGYTEDEIKSWDMQLAEATAYNADNTASTPLLDSMIAVSGNAKADLVTRILAKAEAYSKAFGAALGKKQKAIADLG